MNPKLKPFLFYYSFLLRLWFHNFKHALWSCDSHRKLFRLKFQSLSVIGHLIVRIIQQAHKWNCENRENLKRSIRKSIYRFTNCDYRLCLRYGTSDLFAGLRSIIADSSGVYCFFISETRTEYQRSFYSLITGSI